MRTALPLLPLTVSLILTACSSADPGHDVTAAGPGSLPTPASGASVATDARIDAYLDSLYDRSFVVHSFTTRKGDVVDCVDYAAEPGVRALVAQGATVDEIKASMRRRAAAHGATSSPTPSRDAYVDGSLDTDGNPRVCPADSVPHARVTREQIAAAGGLDAYRRALRHQPPSVARAPLTPQTSGGSAVPATNPTPGGQYAGDTGANGDYGHVFSYQLPASGTSVTGGISTMVIGPDNIFTNNNNSFIDNPENHSLAQIWIVGTGSQTQTLELGWEMDATNGGPYLFVATSQENYQDFCENGNTSIGTTTCVPWVPYPDSGSLYAGAPLTMSVEGGAQHELTMQAIQECDIFYSLGGVHVSCSWDVFAAQDSSTLTFLGSLPDTGYGTGPLSTGAANYFETGGEVLDLSWTFSDVTMGEDTLFDGFAFYEDSAYVRNFGYYDETCRTNVIGGPPCPGAPIETGATVYTTQSEFGYNVAAGAGSSSWSNWFYYGNIYFPRPIILK